MTWEWILSRFVIFGATIIGAFTLSGWGYVILLIVAFTGLVVGGLIEAKQRQGAKDA